MSNDMQIDYNKYDYSRWGTPSTILHRWDKGSPQFPVKPHTFLEPLLKRIQLRHADWTLITKHGRGAGGGPEVTASGVDVYQDQEWLGSIGMGYSRGDRCFEITGPRIDAALRYGRYKKTADEKKAYKIVKDYFIARSFGEAARMVSRQAVSSVANASYISRRNLERVTEKMGKALTSYMLDNLDVVSRALVAYGVPPEISKQLPELWANNRVASDMAEQIAGRTPKPRGVVVAKHSGRYIVVEPDEGTSSKLVTESELTDDQKQKIAMLRVFDRQDEALEGIGMRVGSEIYYLLP